LPADLAALTSALCICVALVWLWFHLPCVCTVFSVHLIHTGSFLGLSIHPPCVSLFCSKSRTFRQCRRTAARNERPNAKGPRQSTLLLPTFPSAAPSVRPLATLSPVSVCHMRCCCHCCCLCWSKEDTVCSLYVFLCKLEPATHAHTLPVFSACAVSCLCVSVRNYKTLFKACLR